MLTPQRAGYPFCQALTIRSKSGGWLTSSPVLRLLSILLVRFGEVSNWPVLGGRMSLLSRLSHFPYFLITILYSAFWVNGALVLFFRAIAFWLSTAAR